ncbi:DNA ligase D [Panacibacter sp. DH6]|uniref:DNA ligase (ATP) n=1 Tax=Panacibacter microcysteis TaxID=2793269 RepID=A0A931GUH0_9BACT|nr:DNA ligase D [Panacibacter microcysteis]MBG9375370.1 DNA ligase D [Panacibacter microcysteis]
MSLTAYNKKRDFKQTKEPKGTVDTAKQLRFVVQRHEATRLHYDFRLELGGVLKSWAVPKGPSLNPSQKRLAVMVEDHPVDYIGFKGTIPEGNYGAGKVAIWDKGTFVPVDAKHAPITEKKALAAIRNGEIKFALKGKKLQGEFVLVRLKDDDKNWLLIKHKDDHAVHKLYDAEDEKDGVIPKKTVASIRHGKAKKLTKFIKPMLASIAKTAFDDKDWIFEVKWDGYRAVTEIKKGKISFYSRNGIDFSARFPALVKELSKIKHDVVLDGEIVLMNDKNLPDFQKLQHYENHLNYPLLYYVFDILELDGKATTSLALTDRKALVKKLLKNNKVVRYCDHVEEDGISFFATAKAQGLEGIIAKKKDSTYAKGVRSKEWVKIKNIQSTESVIVGYTAPKGGRHHFGSLILANKKGKSWQYRGHVGTGFNDDLLASLKKLMGPLETDSSPFMEKVPVNGKTTWLKPTLVADIAYTEITRDGIFRHPVFLRLRDEKKISAMNDESEKAIDPVEKNRTIKIGRDEVLITNQHKIFWPDEGYTKGDVVNYYDSVAKYILPHLKNRPLSLKRNPNGIRDAGFFHKDAGENAPSYASVFPVHSESSNKTVDYIVCNNKATLLYLANLGCIEINPWNSTVGKPDHPTWMVIDIDPSDKNDFKQVVDVALMTKEILDKAKITCFCKTSGASGLHVYAPLKNKYDYNTVKDFAHIIATLVNEQLPEFTSLERSLSKRGPNIYMDYLQNRSGQTLAAVYSLRPVEGASASTALEWEEVNHSLHPSQFNIQTLPQRLEKKHDLFNKMLTTGNNIEKAIKLLNV